MNVFWAFDFRAIYFNKALYLNLFLNDMFIYQYFFSLVVKIVQHYLVFHRSVLKFGKYKLYYNILEMNLMSFKSIIKSDWVSRLDVMFELLYSFHYKKFIKSFSFSRGLINSTQLVVPVGIFNKSNKTMVESIFYPFNSRTLKNNLFSLYLDPYRSNFKLMPKPIYSTMNAKFLNKKYR